MAGRANNERELQDSMVTIQAAWTERPRDSGIAQRSPYMAIVPQDILDHPVTDIESLNGCCRERGITFGERPSTFVLRAKLIASDADLQTVWSL